MKPISEKTYQSFFRVGIIIKTLIGLGEVVLGLVFAFLSYDTLRQVVFALVGGELMENPRDFIWEYIFRIFQGFSVTPQLVWAFIFLSHGIVNIFLLVELWRNKLWIYPASAVIFSGFIAYQFYKLTFAPSILLWLIIILDIAVVILIIHEYRYRKDHRRMT